MPEPLTLVALAGAAFAAGLVQGLSGFGSALVAVPIMALVLPMETVVPLMALLGFAISALNLPHLRRQMDLKPLRMLLLGYLIGTPLGLWFLVQAPEVLVLAALGLLIIGYAGMSLAGCSPDIRALREQRFAIGTLSGALGAAFSINGPPVILHVAAHQQWPPNRQKAVLVHFLFAAGAVTVLAMALKGLIDARVLWLWLPCAPTLVLGTLLGIRLYHRLGHHDYRRLVFVLVLIMGMVLLARAGSALLM